MAAIDPDAYAGSKPTVSRQTKVKGSYVPLPDLTPAKILQVLANGPPEGMKQAAIACSLGVLPDSISSRMDRMKKRGVVLHNKKYALWSIPKP
jgi:hypothetical protein